MKLIDKIDLKSYDNYFGKYKHYIIPNYNYHVVGSMPPINGKRQIYEILNKNEIPNIISNIDFSFLDFSLDMKQNLYINLEDCNKHHWTTEYVFNNVLPKIANDLNINFNKDDFIKIDNFYMNCDLSFHEFKNYNYKFKIINLITNEQKEGEHRIIVRQIGENASGYHNLVRWFHQCIRIENENPNLNRKLLINVDSMSIPIIPILAYYFKEIVVLDKRPDLNQVEQTLKTKNFNLIKDIDFSDYFCMLINDNYKKNKFLSNMQVI